ncbi:MAG TPA: DEAD/DEAH box helicase family protein [Candidatus Saccharimonadales bacterium]|nr:DEAD/DEAH box helicase family protein [Candidatus Saccharimonadales bacterium]
MAYCVDIKTLNHEQRASIIKCLTFIYKQDYNDNTVKEPLAFYVVNQHMLSLPYMFASSYFGIIPNMNHMYHQHTFQFHGTLRENQIPVFDEAKQQLETYGTTGLYLIVSYGKMIIGTALAAYLKRFTVVLIVNTTLLHQWVTTFTKYTNAKVCLVDNENEEIDYNQYDVIVCMDTRYHKIPLAVRQKVATLIIDEAHLFCTPKRVGCLLGFNPIYIIVETATPERDDEMHHMIYAMIGSHGIYRNNTKPFFVHKLLTNTSVERKMTRQQKIDYIKLQNHTLMDKRRNDIIVNLVKHHPDDHILILTSLINHVHVLYEQIKLFDSCDTMCGNKKSYDDCRVLIGTTHKIGTGFDQETFCKSYNGVRFNILILAFSIKKYQMLIQNVGRVLRADVPHVYHLVDNDVIFNNHWKKCEQWYKKRAVTLNTINVTDKVIDMDKSIIKI